MVQRHSRRRRCPRRRLAPDRWRAPRPGPRGRLSDRRQHPVQHHLAPHRQGPGPSATCTRRVPVATGGGRTGRGRHLARRYTARCRSACKPLPWPRSSFASPPARSLRPPGGLGIASAPPTLVPMVPEPQAGRVPPAGSRTFRFPPQTVAAWASRADRLAGRAMRGCARRGRARPGGTAGDAGAGSFRGASRGAR